MKQALIKILPADDHKRKWVAVGITVFIAGLLSVLSIYGMGDYGVALFVLIPLFMGANPTILCGLFKDVKRQEYWFIPGGNGFHKTPSREVAMSYCSNACAFNLCIDWICNSCFENKFCWLFPWLKTW